MGYYEEIPLRLALPRHLPGDWRIVQDQDGHGYIVTGADRDGEPPRVVIHVTYAVDRIGFDQRHQVASAITTALYGAVKRDRFRGVRTR